MEDITNDTTPLCLPQSLCVHICQCIMEETLDQLFILQRIKDNNFKIKDVTRPRTFGETNKESQIAKCAKHNLKTFEKNFNFLEKTVRTVYEELARNGTYEKLVQIVKTLNKSKLEETNIKEETVRLHIEHKTLDRTLYEEEHFFHKKIAECMSDIGKIKDKIEDFLVESEIKSDYIEKWQNSKIEMNEILLEGKVAGKMTELKKIDADIYKESRVHQEIIAAYNEIQKDIMNEIDTWKDKYAVDCKELEDKIEAIKNKRAKQIEATRILKETYLRREREISDYKIYKIQQEEKKLILKEKNDAATKIQAWWRGTMVRKGFGKFRKKKDKKGKKKGPEKQENK